LIKKLYDTNFFQDIKIDAVNNKLVIDVIENRIIQNITVEGVKSKSLIDSILESIVTKNKSPLIKNRINQDANRILSSLNNNGYYFANISTRLVENDNDSVDLIFNIDLGDKAKISKISFIGDKKFKDRTLRNIIISEENKFWKFISRNTYLNQSLIDSDIRLLKNFYLNRGFYDIVITSTNAVFNKDNSFELIFRVDPGNKYIVNQTKLNLPVDYNIENFQYVLNELNKMNNQVYSLNQISKVVKEIDQISLSREYDFINAEVVENKISDDKIDIYFNIKESEKFYVERINILGNNITHEDVIRKSLEIDEGDPFNELLNTKSINNLKSLNIFKSVNFDIKSSDNDLTKIIDIEVEEKPTGEISLGAGFGSEGGTLGFSIAENNFLGRNIKLSTYLNTSDTTIRGGFILNNPDYNYSKKSLITGIESSNTDKLSTNGYKTTTNSFSIGTNYEQYNNIYFSPTFSSAIEDIETSSNASASLKKQSGKYFENIFSYSFDFDNRNQKYQTFDGTRTVFSQGIPIYSDDFAFTNSFDTKKWINFSNDMVMTLGFYGKTINSMNDEDVRISKRLSLPRKKLKGFKTNEIGPVDNNDFIGGNYASSINFDTTLPMLLPSLETIDFKYFIDVGNVWGVDYSKDIDESNEIRSSTGLAVDWFTPIGPLNFSLAQNLSKAKTDKTENFQFNLGTTF
jgi:outer membrane protein insertion porin family